MNVPYVKQIENKVVTNPIKGSYISEFPNRRERRQENKKDRFMNNRKTTHLTIYKLGPTKVLKYKRERQLIDGKVIEHYVH